ncbi:MAG: hypothetical protein HKL81_07890 [Acidimicrobiaceae bacterium]|nr:hypothetical protein [Acidimicrobiaceae bacterium]
MYLSAIGFPFSLTSAVAKVFDLLGSMIQKALAKSYTWEIKGLLQLVNSTSKVELHASFFISEYKVVALIAAILALPLVLVAVCQALLLQGPSQLLRLVGLRLPGVAIITLLTVPISSELLRVSDWASSVILSPNGASLSYSAFGKAIANLSYMPFWVGSLIVVLGSLAALVVWIELILRTSLIYLIVCSMPLVALGILSPSTMGWTRRAWEMLVALIFAKVAFALSLALGGGAIAGSFGGSNHSFAQLVQGLAILILTILSPYVVFRIFTFAEVQAVSAFEGAALRPYAKAAAASRIVGALAVGGVSMAAGESMDLPLAERLGGWTGYGPPEHLKDWEMDFDNIPSQQPNKGA